MPDLATARREWIDHLSPAKSRRGPEPVAFTNSSQIPPGLRHVMTPDGGELDEEATGWFTVSPDEHISINVSARVLFEEHHPAAGVVGLTIQTQERSAHIAEIQLPQRCFGQGHGKRFMIRLVACLDSLGVQTLTVQAKGVGKYLWANCGFDFSTPADRERVNRNCSRLARALEVIDSPSSWQSVEHPWLFANALTTENGERLVIDRKRAEDVIASERSTPAQYLLQNHNEVDLVKVLLTQADYSHWNGRFDLHSELQREVLTRYAVKHDVVEEQALV